MSGIGQGTVSAKSQAWPWDLVYKLFGELDWQQAQSDPYWLGSAADRRDGFVHLSSADQVTATAAKYFANVGNVMLVGFAPSDLGPGLRFEVSRDGQYFPHLYGPLPMPAARWQAAWCWSE